MKIYVGNISNGTANIELRMAFERFGKVAQVTIETTGSNGNSARFATIEMHDILEAREAIDGWNGHKLNGKVLLVNEAGVDAI